MNIPYWAIFLFSYRTLPNFLIANNAKKQQQ